MIYLDLFCTFVGYCVVGLFIGNVFLYTLALVGKTAIDTGAGYSASKTKQMFQRLKSVRQQTNLV